MGNAYFQLLRINQWYKNLVILLPLVFSGLLLNIDANIKILIGLVALCLVSSSNYIINDISDRESDRKNPEKKGRPIAAGKIPVSIAATISVILLALSLIISITLSWMFFASVLGLFVSTTIYTFWLKKIPFVDILTIAVNFVVRAASGAFIIKFSVSPWLILCVFFLSLFLSTGKRASELSVLSSKAQSHRETLKYYTPDVTKSLLNITTTLLVIAYSLYSFMSQYPFVIFSLPFALYTIFHFLQLIYSNSIIARHPQFAFKDKALVIGVLLWVISVLIAVYI